MDIIKNQEILLRQIEAENNKKISVREYGQYMINGRESDELMKDKVLRMESLLARYNSHLEQCIDDKRGGDNVDTEYSKLIKIKPPLDLLTNKELEKLEITGNQKGRLFYYLFYKDGKLYETEQPNSDTVILTNLSSVDSILFSVRDLVYICRKLQNYWIIELTPSNAVIIARMVKLTVPLNEFETAYLKWVKENVKEMYKLPISGCADFYRKYGFEVHISNTDSVVPLLWTQQNTPSSISEIFHEYAAYSEYDYINMDWTEYDKKIFPLVEKSACEVGGTLHIKDRKIKITNIQAPDLPGATRIISYDVMKFHIHPNTRYGGLFLEIPSSADIVNTIHGYIDRSVIVSIVGTAEGVYIITLPTHIAKYGTSVYDAALATYTFSREIGDRSPITFIQAINKFKRACLNYGIIIYFRPTPGFDLNATINNADAIQLKYKVDFFENQEKIINKYKTPADILKLNFDVFDKIRYIFNMEVLFWVIFDETDKLAIAPEQEIIFSQPFSSMSQEIQWSENNPKIKFALIYFPRDKMIDTNVSQEAINFVFSEYSINWLILLSPSVILIAQRGAPLYGPINRTTMKPLR